MLYPAAAQDIAMASIDEFLASQPDGGSALRRRLLLRRMQWSIKDNLPAWAVRPLQKAWHRARQGSGALAAVGHDGTGELLFDDVYEAARHLSGRHAG